MTQSDIKKAVKILHKGGLVAFPTETVYGLGGDATNREAIAQVFSVKGRPADHPLIVHIGGVDHLSCWAIEISADAYKLARAFWPGPVTLILKKAAHVLDIVTGGQDTVGLRMPRHPVALDLIQSFGGGIVGPSANLFTQVSPTTMQAVQEELGDKIDFVLDGGDCEVGLESTIVDMTKAEPVILRSGMISAADMAAVLNKNVVHRVQRDVRVPGMHPVHYAPKTKVVLLQQLNESEATIAALSRNQKRVALLTVGECPKELAIADNVHVINMPNKVSEYAQQLYRTLRMLDSDEHDCIVIEMVPAHEEWGAIRDRLLKASGRK